MRFLLPTLLLLTWTAPAASLMPPVMAARPLTNTVPAGEDEGGVILNNGLSTIVW